MEENNKQSEQEIQESVNEEPKEQGTPLRSSVIMLLAGVYLLYTGYKLCQDVLNGTNDSSWGFFAAGVGFLIVGVVMLVVGGRDLMKREKEKRAREAAAKAEIQEQPETAESKKSMSIAERAHLVDALHEEENVSEKTEEMASLDKKSDNQDIE